jgi:invasion protein IalB
LRLAKASCVSSEEVIDGKSRARIANLRLVQQGKNESLVIIAPYNVLLRAGLGIAFGNAKARRYPYITCTGEGCIAQIPVDDTLRASLREGPRGVLLVTGMNGQITQIPFSLRGFERADKARRHFESSFWWLPA